MTLSYSAVPVEDRRIVRLRVVLENGSSSTTTRSITLYQNTETDYFRESTHMLDGVAYVYLDLPYQPGESWEYSCLVQCVSGETAKLYWNSDETPPGSGQIETAIASGETVLLPRVLASNVQDAFLFSSGLSCVHAWIWRAI